MTAMYFAQPWAFALYLLVAAMAGMLLYAHRKRRAALRRFGVPVAPVKRRVWKAGLVLLGASLLVLAAARPQLKGPATAPSGRDVVFLLDVSRSMLAADLMPSRLQSARQAISDLLPSLADARVGLVSFAGSTELLCPLTTDFEFFRAALKQASPDAAAAPGTRLASSIGAALEDAFDDVAGRSRYLIMITDGEDHGAFSLEQAKFAPRLGVGLIIVGVGDNERGSRIPVGTQFVTWQGREVWSKLDQSKLQAISVASAGSYVHVGTDASRFGEIRVRLAKPSPPRAAETSAAVSELFRVPALAGFLLLCAEVLIAERGR